MIKFIFAIIGIIALYFGFKAVSEYDSILLIYVFDYVISTNFFSAVALFITCQLFFLIIIKSIIFFFNIPNFIKDALNQRKIRNFNKKILVSLGDFFMDKNPATLKHMASTIDNKDFSIKEILLAESEENFDKKIQHLRNLIPDKTYRIYAFKSLAKIFYESNHLKEAEDCAIKALEKNGKDAELLLLMVRIYANSSDWENMDATITKLKRVGVTEFKNHCKEIAEYYFKAAHNALGRAMDKEALAFLRTSLQLYPNLLESLSLFVELSSSNSEIGNAQDLLEIAFKVNPSFELGLLYCECYSGDTDKAFDSLIKLTNKDKYSHIFLALAAHFDLPEKIALVKKA